MFCIFDFSDAFAAYVLLLLGALAALYCIELWRARANDWHVRRLTVRKCASCGLVFAVGRFAKHALVHCPRCNHRQNGHKGND